MAGRRVMARPTVEVTVRGIAAGGAGVADLPDGRVVFVPRTAPGDRASISVTRSKARWATASLRELIEPSTERREAPCALYDICGGCQLQHLPYEKQLAWKARIVMDALERIGGMEVADMPLVFPSPREVHYRNRITFALRRLGGGRVVAGFHALERPGRVVDVRSECLLPRPVLLDAWVELRSGWGAGAGLLPRGDQLRLTLREEPSGVVLVVEGGEPGWSAVPLIEMVPALIAVWHRPGEERRAPYLAGGSADEGAPAFAQVNVDVAARLRDRVISLAGATGTAVDAYAGTGEYALRLAESGWMVTAIEHDPAACEAARHSSRGLYVVVEGPVEERLRETLPADLLIVNPPRAGLDPRVVRSVLDRPPARLVYVSCDPATLARDVGALKEAYRLSSLDCFDLFPQTAHVETVLTLVRSDR